MDHLRRLPLLLSSVALVVAVGAAATALTTLPDDEADPVTELFAPYPERGYSLASRYGDLVWTAGHLPETAAPGDSVTLQTEAVMDALEATLEEAGAGFDTVLMTNVYLTDFEDWDSFNSVYGRYFEDRLPPRVTVQISQLGIGDIEISMVAHVRAE